MIDKTAIIIESIKKIKEEKKLTNKKLSEISEIPLGTLNKILSGKVKSIKIETLEKLRTSLGQNSALTNHDYGFIRVGTSNFKVKLADVNNNEQSIKQEIDKALLNGVQVLVFQEMTLTGYTIGDLVYQEVLLNKVKQSLLSIVEFSKDKNLLIFVGMPLKVNGLLYSVACAVFEGEILAVIPKSNVFADSKYFSSFDGENIKINIQDKQTVFGTKIILVNKNNENVKISCEIGNDLFSAISPSSYHYKNGSVINVNLGCFNETYKTSEDRVLTIKAQSLKNKGAYLLSNGGYGESTSDFIYSGHSVICEKGKILKESEYFRQGLIFADIDAEYLNFLKCKGEKNHLKVDKDYSFIYFDLKKNNFEICKEYSKSPFINEDKKINEKDCNFILELQAQALSQRINHINAKTLVIGVSGGLDSTLALLVCKRAMEISNKEVKDIIGVTMPCFGTSSRTKSNAVILMEELGVTIKEIDISNAVRQHFKDIEHDESIADVTFENSQARERTQILMDLANKTNGIVIGTGDLSELALGFCTYNGDHMSMYSVNATVPKTLMRDVLYYQAKKSSERLKNVILDIIDTPVSPELLPVKEQDFAQKTEDIVGPYILHDFFLYYIVGCSFSPKKVFYIAKHTFKEHFSEKTIYKWLYNFYRRFFTQQFKRSCQPDGAKVTEISLSIRGDWNMPSDATSKLWLSELEEIKIV